MKDERDSKTDQAELRKLHDTAARAWDFAIREAERKRWERIARELGVES